MVDRRDAAAAGPVGRRRLAPVDRDAVLWLLVVFFGGTVLFGGLRRLTEDSSTGVTIAVQFGALALVVAGLWLFVRRRR